LGSRLKNRVFVLGIDGGTWRIFKPAVAAGRMPFLGQLLARGSHGRLWANTPPNTPPGWTSLLTGLRPGSHGLFDFQVRRPGSYDLALVGPEMVGRPNVFQLLSRAGCRVGLVNIPFTYPPFPDLNGFQVSGFTTPPGVRDHVRPPDLPQRYPGLVPPAFTYPQTFYQPGRARQFAAENVRRQAEAARMILKLMDAEPWQAMMAVLLENSEVLHRAIHLLLPDHPAGRRSGEPGGREAILDFYEALDESLRLILTALGPRTHAAIVSDHGFIGGRTFIYLNTWLLREGYLRIKPQALARLKRLLFAAGLTVSRVFHLLESLHLADRVESSSEARTNRSLPERLAKRLFLSFEDVDWPRTRAYSVGRCTGAIYLNLASREPQGSVRPGREAEGLLDEIGAKLSAWRTPDGRPRFKVSRRDEVYQGEMVERAPDLIIEPLEEGDYFFGLVDFASHRVAEPAYRVSGAHHPEGMYLWLGPGVKAGHEGPDYHLEDLAPTLLRLLGFRPPDFIEGRPMAGCFEGLAEPEEDLPGYRPAPRPERGRSQAEKEMIERRLRELGYLA